ncbi:DUF2304 domain-containing protein [Ruminococcaceae bacterium OttesenSCG-928-I18]|nr:DUF2304 domain-containing protein [Ruminococcaceae bacterium OttesenSCG-928-I18]
MNLALRLLLLTGAVVTLVYFIVRIRKKQLQIPYAISWGLFSGLLFLLSLFPGLITWVSLRIGFESPANFVYLVVIFLLILQLFSVTVQLSTVNRQITDMAQHIALQEKKGEERREGEEDPQDLAREP